MKKDPIGYWMGEPISEMSRERLLEMLVVICRKRDAEADLYEKSLRAMAGLVGERRPRRRWLGIF